VGTKTALILVHTVMTIPFTVLILTVFFRRVLPKL
jgi:ABC-type glycerol-3-phosphate transport system permease component